MPGDQRFRSGSARYKEGGFSVMQMQVLRLIIIAASGLLLFVVLSGIWEIASGRSSVYRTGSKQLTQIQKQQRKALSKSVWLEPPLITILTFLGSLLILDEEKELMETDQLSRAELPYTARQFKAKKLLLLISGVALTFVFYLCGLMIAIPIGLGLTLALYYKASQELAGIIKEKNQDILQCLPPFILSVIAGLNNDSDIIAVVERYTPFAGTAIKQELEIFVLNMKTGGINKALETFRSRMSIDEVTRLINILINVNRGINQDEPLRILSGDMDRLAQDSLTKKYSMRPQKLKRAIIPSGIIAVISMLYVLLTSLPSAIF